MSGSFIAQSMQASDRVLPSGWARSTFGEILRLINGRAYKQEELLTSGVPVLRIQNLNGGDRWYYSDLSLDAEKYCEPGDLLYAWSATFGPYRYTGPRAIFHYHIWRVVPSAGLDADFGFWLLKEITAEVKAAAHGVAMPHMTKAGMESWPVTLPPLNEQRRIVAKLESLQARSRRAREALDAVPPLLEKLRQSILAAAFRGDLTKDWRAKHKDVEPASELLKRIRVERRKKWEEAELAKMKAKGKGPSDDRWKGKYKEPEGVDADGLAELPEGWCWANLGDLAWDAGYGTSAKCDYEGQGVAVLRIPNVARGQLDLKDMKRALTSEDEGEMLVRPGDMLIVRTNGSRDLIGRAAVAREDLLEPTSFASYLIRFRLVSLGALPAWIGRYWQSPAVRAQIEGHAASSAGQYNVSLSELASCSVPVAPPAEQAAVVDVLERLFDGWSETNGTLVAQLASLQRLEQAILAKAFRGDLVPQDPTDEPADAMLARLRDATATPPSEPLGSKGRGRAPREPRKEA